MIDWFDWLFNWLDLCKCYVMWIIFWSESMYIWIILVIDMYIFIMYLDVFLGFTSDWFLYVYFYRLVFNSSVRLNVMYRFRFLSVYNWTHIVRFQLYSNDQLSFFKYYSINIFLDLYRIIKGLPFEHQWFTITIVKSLTDF